MYLMPTTGRCSAKQPPLVATSCTGTKQLTSQHAHTCLRAPVVKVGQLAGIGEALNEGTDRRPEGRVTLAQEAGHPPPAEHDDVAWAKELLKEAVQAQGASVEEDERDEDAGVDAWVRCRTLACVQ